MEHNTDFFERLGIPVPECEVESVRYRYFYQECFVKSTDGKWFWCDLRPKKKERKWLPSIYGPD